MVARERKVRIDGSNLTSNTKTCQCSSKVAVHNPIVSPALPSVGLKAPYTGAPKQSKVAALWLSRVHFGLLSFNLPLVKNLPPCLGHNDVTAQLGLA